jgi:hypothetical protein
MNALLKSPPIVPLRELLELWEEPEYRTLPMVRTLARADRYFLLVKVLRRYDCIHPWVYERCREVEADPDGYLDIWAREHYKSTIITYAGVIQEIIKNPEITIGLFSHSRGIAKKFASQIMQELATNDLLKAAFPDILWRNPEREAPKWGLESGLIVKRQTNPKEATLEAWGLVDGQPTSTHFQLLLYDDVVTLESVNTPDMITKTTEAWSMSDNLGVAGGRKQYVGTRYHFADTYGEIEKRGAAKVRLHPATDDGTVDGNPVLMTRAQWARKKIDQLEATVACQLLCNPLAGHQRMFNVQDLQVYEARPLSLMGYLICDPARSNKKGSAHTAMVVLALDAAGNKYLLDGVDHKMDLMERWRWLRDLRNAWFDAPGMMGFKVGYESFGAQADMDYFHERMRVEGERWDIEELTWPRDGEGSKVDRVQRLGPDIKGHRFYLPYPTDPERLTKLQRKMVAAGYGYRVSQQIRRVDQDDKVYDVTERLRLQISFFPFGGLKDLVDAASRIYDMEPTPPEHVDQTSLEPEIT